MICMCLGFWVCCVVFMLLLETVVAVSLALLLVVDSL